MNTYHSKFDIKSISKIDPNFKVLEEKNFILLLLIIIYFL